MARVALIHWNAADGERRAELLRRLGHETLRVLPEGGAVGLKPFLAAPPDAFVIDLDRLPSQGRAVAVLLRQRKATRAAPLVFAGGEPDKVRGVRRLLPDAAYSPWDGVGAAIARALQRPSQAPAVVVPGTMDGYSGTPLPKKLGIREGYSVALLNAPKGLEKTLGRLPDGARSKRAAAAGTCVLLLFSKSRAELSRRFPAALRAMHKRGRLWLCWPKKASGLGSDLDEGFVRRWGMERGLVDYKICAVDATWSGLCFARRALKPG